MTEQHSRIQLRDGNTLYTHRFGPIDDSKPTIVLVPGWAYSCEVFQPLQAMLGENYDTVSFDPRGHGRSSNDRTGHTYAQHGRDLAELIEQLGLQRIVLLGWSLGCYDCLCYLHQSEIHPAGSQVEALILADESPTIIKEKSSDWGEGDTEEVEGLIELVNSNAYLDFFSDYMKEGYVDSQPSESLLTLYRKLAAQLLPEDASQLLNDATRYDFREALEQLDSHIALQFIVREHWAKEAQQWVSEHCPNSDFQVLGGHLALLEMPEQFHSITSVFLSQLSSR
ncbi:alpha/beta fold hydrolase [Pseudoteredinibacter isoporae]|uniref:alpha/beta fold hydrolase n=1 Tax=Pseudoteredinibacter isoporae TaxID=570281 RepID=UPI00310BF184